MFLSYCTQVTSSAPVCDLDGERPDFMMILKIHQILGIVKEV